MTFDFDAEVGRALRGGRLGVVDDFDGVHGLWLHPADAPGTWMVGVVQTGLVGNAAVGAVITNVGRLTSGIPT